MVEHEKKKKLCFRKEGVDPAHVARITWRQVCQIPPPQITNSEPVPYLVDLSSHVCCVSLSFVSAFRCPQVAEMALLH